MSCSVAGGSAPAPAGTPAPARPAEGAVPGGGPPPLNMIITGTGPLAAAGVTSVNRMSTSTDVYDELSRCPTSCFRTTGSVPIVALAVSVTVQATRGTFAGTRP